MDFMDQHDLGGNSFSYRDDWNSHRKACCIACRSSGNKTTVTYTYVVSRRKVASRMSINIGLAISTTIDNDIRAIQYLKAHNPRVDHII